MSRFNGKILRTETQRLSVRLEPDEVRDRGERLAALEGAMLNFRLRKKETTAKLKQEETELDTKINELAAIVRAKAEPREVEVEVRQSGKKSIVEIRVDTGQVLLERAMLEDEKQDEMFARGDA